MDLRTRKWITGRIPGCRFLSLVALLFLMILTSCDVHQFPEPLPTPDKPVVSEEKIKVPISIVFDSPDFYLWEHYYDPMLGNIREIYPDALIYPGYPGTTLRYDNTLNSGLIDVTVKAFMASNTHVMIEEKTFVFDLNGDRYDRELEMELPKDMEYVMAVWVHFRQGLEDLPFYDTENFNKLQIIGENYKGNTDYRDAYCGMLNIDTYSESSVPYEIVVSRPMGKFELVTIDLSEFLDRETTRRGLSTRAKPSEYHVLISFPLYYPNSYTVFGNRLEGSVGGVSFMTEMTVTGESEASLGFEYVFLNNYGDGGVQARVDIYDPSYTHVAGSTTLNIPMRRDHHTLLRGAFLSSQGNGGVGIDPGFNGDHNVIW